MAKVTGGNSPEAVFLASPTAILKVVGIGDRLPTGEKIRSIPSFALNNLGQVAFVANNSASVLNPRPLGVFIATPNPPVVERVKVKGQPARKLIINGGGFIVNDSVIELNGQAIDTIYPSEFYENGGTTTSLVSKDPRLSQLLIPGQPVQLTVFNPLTARRSVPQSITR
jgi:hypothetical protein